MFAFFFAILAIAAVLTVVSNRSDNDALVTPMFRGNRHLPTVETGRQSHAILPLR